MPPKLQMIFDFLLVCEKAYEQAHEQRPKGGAKKTYSHSSFILFFISMFLRRIYQFKTMARILKTNYAYYGFKKAPCRKTIRLRYKKLPKVIMYILPYIAKYSYRHLCRKVFNIKWIFSDKSIFRAKGGLWHKKHMKQGIIPHSSIDTDASWAKSPYHGWRFGYGLLIFTNESRIPVAAMADTASFSEAKQLQEMLKCLKEYVGIIVGDAAYKVFKIINQLYKDLGILLLTKVKTIKAKYMQWYWQLIKLPQALHLYSRRKPSVEPAFSLIKELFDLKKETQLPFKGKDYVIPFLLLTAICIQLMALYNFKHNNSTGDTREFVNLLW